MDFLHNMTDKQTILAQKRPNVKNNKKSFAFTLAETLVVLGIIGVVAGLTVPSVVKNHQNTVYVTRLQKAYSTLNNGFKKIMADTGCMDIPCTGIITLSSDTTVDNIANAGVFNIVKTCHKGVTGCYDSMVYYMSNYSAWVPSAYYSLIVLNDGTVFGFTNQFSECNASVGNDKYSAVCSAYYFLDTNGTKKPNRFGKDVFRFYLSKDGLILAPGINGDTQFGYWKDGNSHYNCIGGDGQSCFQRIIDDGWQIKY